MRAIIERPLRSFAALLCALVFAGSGARGQEITSQSPAAGQPDLGEKIEMLTRSIDRMQTELEQSRAEIQQLREMLTQGVRTQANLAPADAVDRHAAVGQQPQSAAAS